MGHAKNSIGNGVAKELICMTCGHELREEITGVNGGYWVEGQRRTNWDDFNNIIKKIYFKNK